MKNEQKNYDKPIIIATNIKKGFKFEQIKNI